MPKTLQRFNHDNVDYDRPNQKWVCGHVCEGRSCALGPSKRGGCRGGAECIPIKDGETWSCTRSEFYGGECEQGPSAEGVCCQQLQKCKPQRTLRSKRRLAVLLAVAATVGLLFVLIGGDSKTRGPLISPGPLSAAHAGTDMECSLCHGSEIGLTDSLHDRAVDMNQNCLECHDNIALQFAATEYAHGLPPEELEKLTAKSERRQQQLLVSWVSGSPVVEAGMTGNLACATCHHEHHGQEAQLTALTNQQCQVCHQQQFDSFSHGHPTFADTDYPYWQRTRIFFDHESHYGSHFAEKSGNAPAGFDEAKPFGESASCRVCHETDEKGSHMRLVSYERNCADCHQDSVRGGEPIPFLTLPHEPHHDHVEGTEHGMTVPPVVLSALSEDSRQTLLTQNGAPADLSAEERRAWRDKRREELNGMLMLDEIDGPVMDELREFHHAVWENGPVEFENRLRENGWVFPDEVGEGELFAGLSLDSMREFLFPGTDWELGELTFPEIDLVSLNIHLAKSNRSIGLWPEDASAPLTPLVKHLLGPRQAAAEALEILTADPDLALDDLSEVSTETLDAVAILAWEIKELHHLVRERGAPFLAQFVALQGGILEVGDTDEVMSQVFFAASSDGDFMAGYVTEIHAYRAGQHPPKIETPAPQSGNGDKPSSGAGDDDFGSDSDDDFGSDADDDFGSDPKPAPPAAADDDFGSDADDDFRSDADDDFGSDPKPDKPAAADDDFGADEAKGDGHDHDHEHDHGAHDFNVFEPSAVRDWQRGGGWFYEHYSLNYKSLGHADPALKNWLDTIAKTASEGATRRARLDAAAVLRYNFDFRSGVKSSAAGKCLKCHTVDVQGTGDDLRMTINWEAAFAKPSEGFELTKFSHVQHMYAMDCTQCHQFAQDQKYASAFPVDDDPWTDWPGLPLAKSNPHEFFSNFKAIDHQASCASCHTRQAAGDSCLQCHFYHHRPIGAPMTPRPKTP